MSGIQNVVHSPTAWPETLLAIQGLRCTPDLLNLNKYLNKRPRRFQHWLNREKP